MYIPTAAAFGGMCIGGVTQWVAALQNVVPLNLANETRKWRLKRDSLHSFIPSWILEKVVFLWKKFHNYCNKYYIEWLEAEFQSSTCFRFEIWQVGKLEVWINQPIFITELIRIDWYRGMLTIMADFLGAIGSGTGILLAVTWLQNDGFQWCQVPHLWLLPRDGVVWIEVTIIYQYFEMFYKVWMGWYWGKAICPKDEGHVESWSNQTQLEINRFERSW